MIPVKLTLRGVYSYQEEQTIDFDNLISGQLFGIFGGVGSGKSTILEAISFALYDDTERLNQRDRRNYNMMNLKSNDLLIDFIFRVGNDDQQYRFKVEGRRNSKNFEDVKSFSRSAYKQNNGEWEPIASNSATDIIGLNYKNFRRTVIIPQGKFQEFLQLGAKDRTQMLKEIFNLGKFELYYKVINLEKRNKEKQDNLNGQLVQLSEVSEDVLKAKETELSEFVKEKEKLNKELEAKQLQEQELTKLKELFVNLESQEELLQKLNAGKPEMERQAQQIKDYEYCLIHFKPLLDREQEQLKVKAALQKDLEGKRKQQATVSKQLKDQRIKFESLKKQYEQRDQFNKRAEELGKLLQIRLQEKALEELDGRLKVGADFLKQKTEEVLKMKDEQSHKKEELAQIRNKQPDIAVLSEIKTWFNQQKNILKILKKHEKDYQDRTNELEKILSHKTLPESLQIDASAADFKELIGTLKELSEKTEKQKSEFLAEEKHLLIQRKLEEFSTNLQDGSPCPICGSTSHPDKLNPEGIEKDLLRISKELEKQEQINKELARIISSFEKYEVLAREKKSAIANLTEELTIEKENLNKHRDNFKWENYSADDEKAIDAAILQSKKLKTKIELLEKELDTNSKNQEKANQLKEQADAKLKKLELEKEKIVSQRDLLSKQVQLLCDDDYQQSDAKIKDEIEELKSVIARVEKEYARMEKSIKELTTNSDVLDGQLKQGDVQLETLKSTCVSIAKNIEEAFAESSFESLELVKSTLAQRVNVEAVKKSIDEFNITLNATRQKIIDLQKQVGDKRFDKEQLVQLQAEVKVLKDKVTTRQEQLGRIKQLIDKLSIDLKKKQELEKETLKLKQRADNISTMKQLFKGSGFVNYISSVYLQELCNSANDRFYKLTRQQLKLELTEDNSFMVRDFLNDGRLRSVKTLSGGQTFQAALSLALALAESVQQQSKSDQNFFFLDEGFGTLDKETLQIVFDTLKMLRKENRVVGVISHVEELQQEIDVYVNVVNDVEKGSQMSFSWESSSMS